MSKIELCICVLFFTLIFVFIVGGIIAGIKPKEMTEEQKNCNHEFVTTSEFTLYGRNGYKVVSKCIKCGYVVK